MKYLIEQLEQRTLLTLVGDTNFDGIINASDYLAIDNSYNNHLSGWNNGDFNGDGVVNGDDYTLIDNSYNNQFAAPAIQSVTPTSANDISISWSDVANDVGFTVWRNNGNGFTNVATIPAGITTYADTGLTPDTTYTYKITTLSNNLTSSPSSATTQSLFAGSTEPAPETMNGWAPDNASNLYTPFTTQPNNFFYTGMPITYTLGPNATFFQVRDYYGNIVDQGTASNTQPISVTADGWYKLYVYGNSTSAQYGNIVGTSTFIISPISPNFPELTQALVNEYPSSDSSEDTLIHDITGMGPERINIQNPNPPSAAVSSVEQDITDDEALYVGKDSQRPSGILVAFTNGTSDSTDIKTIVTDLQGQVEYWEGQNEPDTGAYSGSAYVPVEEAFYNTVKSVNSSLQVVGPATAGIVSPGGDTSVLSWLNDFLAAGGGNYINDFSFHAYDSNEGSLNQLRESLANLTSILDSYGLSNMPIWQTEQGYPTALYGSYQPATQGQWTMLQMMVYEQFGIPKEHNVLWYDASHGYWDVPDWWQNDDGTLLPAVALMNEWSQQLFGTSYQSAYNFGSANNLYIGSLFSGPGKSVVALMSAGESDGSITVNVSGSTLDVEDAFGNETVYPVVGGSVTLTVPEEPVYVDLLQGQTLSINPQNWGPDLALLSGTSANYSGSAGNDNNIGEVINGVQENWYWNGVSQWGIGDDTDVGANLQITLPSEEVLSRVVIFAMPMWQLAGTLMDYDLQYQTTGGNWVTLQHVVQQGDTFGVSTPTDQTTVDTYFQNQYIFQAAFSPIHTDAIRLVINAVSYGGGATELVPEAGGQASSTPTLTIDEIEMFG